MTDAARNRIYVAIVAGLQRISALARDDMRGVARASRALGASKTRDARGVHSDFDTSAMDAEGSGLPKRTRGQLSDFLQKGSACRSYRLTGAMFK